VNRTVFPLRYFLESIKLYQKRQELNFVIIGNYSLLVRQANYLDFKININFNFSKIENLKNVKYNFINIDYNQSKPF
jgi:hypothetical protein